MTAFFLALSLVSFVNMNSNNSLDSSYGNCMMCSNQTENAIVSGLSIGDKKTTVTKKLSESKEIDLKEEAQDINEDDWFVKSSMDGKFYLKQAINGIRFSFYFDWDLENGLKNVMLRSDSFTDNTQQIKDVYEQVLNILCSKHGAHGSTSAMPNLSDLTQGKIRFHQVWELPSVRVALGVGKFADGPKVIIAYNKVSDS